MQTPVSSAATSGSIIKTLTLGAAPSPDNLYPPTSFAGFGDSSLCGVQTQDMAANTYQYGTINSGSPFGSIQLGIGEYFNSLELYINPGVSPSIQYLKLTTNKGQVSEGGTKTGTSYTYTDIRIVRVNFTSGTPSGGGAQTVTGLSMEYVENYEPRTVLEVTNVVMGYLVGPANFTVHANDENRWIHSSALVAQAMASQGGNGSALADFYWNWCGLYYIGQQPQGPYHLAQLASNVLNTIGSGTQPRQVAAGEVMVMNCSATVYQNGNHIWFDTTGSGELHHDCFPIDDYKDLCGRFDLTGTLSSVITGLQAFQTNRFGFTYYNSPTS